MYALQDYIVNSAAGARVARRLDAGCKSRPDWTLALRVAATILPRELVKPRPHIVGQRCLDRCQRGIQLFRSARAHDWRGDLRLAEYPGNRQRWQRDAGVRGYAAKLIDRRELAVVPVALLIILGRGAEGEPRAFGRRLVSVVLSRQSSRQPAGCTG